MSFLNIMLLVIVVWICLFSIVDRICSCAQKCTYLKYWAGYGKGDENEQEKQ